MSTGVNHEKDQELVYIIMRLRDLWSKHHNQTYDLGALEVPKPRRAGEHSLRRNIGTSTFVFGTDFSAFFLGNSFLIDIFLGRVMSVVGFKLTIFSGFGVGFVVIVMVRND